ncbi:MAG TPA: four helix bundle protein [Gemmatimonadales bacterium]|nr:four helix bundle protein [Gemmatimonadales bacterium]
MHRYRELRAWAKCRELALAVYRTSSAFPPFESHGITAQIRRAAVSAVTNVAEGSAKAGKAEFCRFLDMALGSLAEVDALLDLASSLEYMDSGRAQELFELREEASKLTFALKRRIRL